MAANENLDPRDVAAALDELVEEAFAIVARAIEPGGLTEHQAINQLVHLFETGAGYQARAMAEQLLRPKRVRPA